MAEEPIVDVWDEPHHHRLFENGFAQVVRVRLSPGETMLFHRHGGDGGSRLPTD